jgi:geranylgeranyl diphosphate synthase, type II
MEEHKEAFEKKLIEIFPDHFGPKTTLSEACRYALLNGGKRFRPIIVMMVIKALGNVEEAWEAALGVEYFHTASLIADDLPCMDDDDMRRGEQSLHKAFDEATALLASYALIAAGYRSIYSGVRKLQSSSLIKKGGEEMCMMALENATANTGIFGVTGGQYLDLSFEKGMTIGAFKEVVRGKTGTLYEIAFVFGWLFGLGEVEKLEGVKKAAGHFGAAFQIADDFDDVEQDRKNGTDTNLVILIGEEEGKKVFEEEMAAFEDALEILNVNSEDFKALKAFLVSVVEKATR